MNDQTHYAAVIVRAAGITDFERKFCASIIAQKRRGRAISQKQHEVMGRIVAKFQEATMRDEGAVTDD